ncbi:MAG: T9SS type A sorting domain-containing protein [Paludibacteraceae bacterium]|nr:T9SS type A sorting domain-containing protein [Paludibacteraceae bacterium]
MKTNSIINGIKRRLLLLALAMMSVHAWSGTNYDYIDKIHPSNGASVSYEAEGGYYTITFVYYFNPTSSAKDVSLDNDSYINVRWNGQDHRLMNLEGESDESWVDFSGAPSNDSDGYLWANGGFTTSGRISCDVDDGNEAKATVYWYPPIAALGYTPSFYFHFNIEEDEDGEDPMVRDATKSPGITLPCVNTSNVSLSCAYSKNTNKLEKTIMYTGTVPKNLYWGDTPFNGSSKLTGECDRSASPKTLSETVTLKYSTKTTQTATVTTDIKGYQAINKFESAYDPKGVVKLSWELEPTSDATKSETGFFEIQRATTSAFTDAITITATASVVAGQTKYTFDDDLVSANVVDSVLYYRITRDVTKVQWGFNFGKNISIAPDYKHVAITDAKSELIEVDGYDAIKITWDYNDLDYMWSQGSEFIIERNNLTAGTTQTISGLKKNVIADKVYVDRAVTKCNTYLYKVYVAPGNEKFKTQQKETGRITPSKMGALASADASKGYYSDRVELEWHSIGTFDKFAIKRRIHGKTDTEWATIQFVDGASVILDYMASDLTAQAGYVYDYQIIGLANCADSTLATDPVYATGFRTPTGDFYGQVTFPDGQVEDSVEVRLSTTAALVGQSIHLTTEAYAEVNDATVLSDPNASVSLQAWVMPDAATATDQHLITKAGMYDLGLKDGHVYFQVGDTRLVDTTAIPTTGYTQFTAVYDAQAQTAAIYVNGRLKSQKAAVAKPNASGSALNMGKDYAGYLEEVRLWNIALQANSVQSDYGRHLAGDEDGLVAYYNFDYSYDDNFFDVSYTMSGHNKRHGVLHGAELSTVCPTIKQLAYRGLTDESGVYTMHAVPYYGNNTAYTLTPRKGTHTFEPKEAIRILSATSPNHTVNFKDNSAFDVSGTVRYTGGTMPVEGASFMVDGVVAKTETGTIIKTNADGQFQIQVPVGVHEVKVVKDGHTFENDGKITYSTGENRNYQDVLTGVELWDKTRVKFVGRVAGGVVQESYPVGFGLSKNNLGEGIKLVLNHKLRGKYKLSGTERTECFVHHDAAYSNTQTTGEDGVTISVNDTTGEFVAWLPPVTYSMSMDGTNYDFGVLQDFNFDNVVTIDTFDISGKDTVRFNKAMKFIKRFEPIIDVRQLDDNGKRLPYFGEQQVELELLNNAVYAVTLYDVENGTYLFGKPVFDRSRYNFDFNVCETYTYYDRNGKAVWTDSVPTQDATVVFYNELSGKAVEGETVPADSLGYGTYSFYAQSIDLTSATGHIWAAVTYGSSSTSFDWVAPFADGEVYTLGFWSTGTDFVTAGPNKVLMVLRDPPGSNSYSYLEKGLTFSTSTKYHGSLLNDGWDGGSVEYGVTIKQAIGQGVANMTQESAISSHSLGAIHKEEYLTSSSKKSTTTITTRFQTSSDPVYVGADGDVYVGYSTNVTFGSTENIAVVPRSVYEQAGTNILKVYDSVPGDWLLVRTIGRNFYESFNTTFAYPQKHIEQVLIPNLIKLRNSLLVPYVDSAQCAEIQELANITDRVYFVSYFPKESEYYGLSNDDPLLAEYKSMYGNPSDQYDGPSYKMIHSKGPNAKPKLLDSVAIYNQWINQWKFEMGRNEYQKLKVKDSTRLQVDNYSFQGGSEIAYSESYASEMTHSNTFSFTIGANYTKGAHTTTEYFTRTQIVLKLDEKITTTHTWDWDSEINRNQTKGFVLSEDGGDYLSVSVYREPLWRNEDEFFDYQQNLGTVYQADTASIHDKDIKSDTATAQLRDKSYFTNFIFITEGGATACPYEGATYAKYLKVYNDTMAVRDTSFVQLKNFDNVELNKATLQKEVPYISMQNNFLENVPSGEPAYFTVYMRNNSESNSDRWFDVSVVDESNPDGAQISFDGTSVSGMKLGFLVKAGETLVKTMAVNKGRALNYDNLQVALASQCQANPEIHSVIADTITFTVHYLPTCTDLSVVEPSNQWIYNTKCRTAMQNGLLKHYMPVKISKFDANYSDFDHIELQYKPASASDNEWSSLCYWYADSLLYQKSVQAGNEARMIVASDAGTLTYNFFMDDMFDQKYDIRAVSVCNINNELYYNPSEVVSGVKDMYNPRLFGAAKPANGILTVEDEIRLDFNEPIAEGLLSINNFTVTGIRNGAATDHDVSIQLDGVSAYLTSELDKNYSNKSLTIEGWINPDKAQDATIFSHGDASKSLTYQMTTSGHVIVRFGDIRLTSAEPAVFEHGSWNHVALTYDAEEEMLTAYVNWVAVIEAKVTDPYMGIGKLQIGRDLVGENNYLSGKVDQFRVWNACRTSAQLQANAAVQLSGNEVGLIGYYAMDEARGTITEDKARGANLILVNTEWALPDGYAAQFDGKTGYISINTSATVVNEAMDYTLEFWFKTDEPQTNATMLCNGDGIENTYEVASDCFWVGWNADGVLCYRNNGYETPVKGQWCDGEWHQFALTVSRSSGHGRIYMDGELVTYISSDMVGGISSDKMFAGARVSYHYDSTYTTVRQADRFYSGKIDEIRLWNLYRTQAQMKEQFNQKLSGKEVGLLLYYPFEHYITYQGVPELQYTLRDYVVDTLLATSTGATIQTSDMAPVRTQGAVSSYRYDFVVNNDALILTLKEDDYRIENTIVTFTAEDIRNLNGNSILSPITWSAYIDRNQLMWQEEEISLTKQQYDECKFTVGISNKGGYIQNYTIQNLPSWLTANPANGTLNPTKSKAITFTIDPGLNVGTYNEVIYLVDAQNVSEPLPLTIVVKGDVPDWNVNPEDYEYNMSVFGQMRVDGVYSMDENDILAAFDGIKCVGMAHTTYNAVTDMYYLLLTIHYNIDEGLRRLSFRMYDASTGTIYAATPSDTILFHSNKIYGTPMDPVIFDCGTEFINNIPLKEGWNWVSFNLKNSEMDHLAQALSYGSWSANEQIKTLTNSATYSDLKQSWNTGGGLDRLDNSQMYLIKVNNDKILPMRGSIIDPTTMPLTILKNQWNYISYLPLTNLTVKTAMAGYEAQDGDVVKSQDAFAMYVGNEWIGSLTYMKANEGYMLRNTSGEDKQLTYPSKASTVSQAPVRRINGRQPYNMSVFAHCDMAQEGDVIYAMVDGDIRGEAVAVPYADGIVLQCLSIAGFESDEKITFLLKRNDETYLSTTSVPYRANLVVGTPQRPIEIDFALNGDMSSMAVYPVPAVTHINVAAVVAPGESVHVEIYNLLGKKIIETPEEHTDGMYVRNIPVAGLSEGSYYLRLVSGNRIKSAKFIKL